MPRSRYSSPGTCWPKSVDYINILYFTLNNTVHTYFYFITFIFLITFKLCLGHIRILYRRWNTTAGLKLIVVITIHVGTRKCRVGLATTSWFRHVISYAPLHLPNKEIVSGFPSQFTKHYFVAEYLYANKSAKDAPVALIETYVFMFSVSLCSSRL